MPPIFSRNRWFGTILLISISFVSGSPATTTLTKAPNPTACPQYCIANEAFATPFLTDKLTRDQTSPKPTSTTPCAEDLCIWGRTPSVRLHDDSPNVRRATDYDYDSKDTLTADDHNIRENVSLSTLRMTGSS
ncbi:hypothetical protein SISSUDRAFT_1064425 [Sistotremastrum suecicum HHB10207 ss-3]|uniref:Uncharacterized protein n=1 Tax=Sistotremastrum suecicum HHB10207 ss-3 TaxID=1314776 RepID=A0A166AN77_9AGAM|nr:hypothetical protein SISSUDRAFT_1064425 [Sistotremastrum suecicum HHB10207 ss-3]